MKILVAVDSFKGSMSSIEAGNVIKEVLTKHEVVVSALADGGEGTTESLVEGLNGYYKTIEVTGPLGHKIEATYGLIPSLNLCVIEMAQAAGLPLVDINSRNPYYTTTYGVGEMILDAYQEGYRKMIIGIGGSSTNDGGAGMLQALGVKLYDKNKKDIPLGAIGLKDLYSIDTGSMHIDVSQCDITVACDVENPLCGKLGASYIYGPQKGATQEQVIKLDEWLNHFANISQYDGNIKGAGAAGGLGFSLHYYLNAKLKPGIDIVVSVLDLKKKIKECDLLITGEGRIDEQTAMGKGPVGLARIAKKEGKKVIAFAGCIGNGATKNNEQGIDAYFPILQGVSTLEEALDKQNAIHNLKQTVQQVFNLIDIFQ